MPLKGINAGIAPDIGLSDRPFTEEANGAIPEKETESQDVNAPEPPEERGHKLREGDLQLLPIRSWHVTQLLRLWSQSSLQENLQNHVVGGLQYCKPSTK